MDVKVCCVSALWLVELLLLPRHRHIFVTSQTGRLSASTLEKCSHTLDLYACAIHTHLLSIVRRGICVWQRMSSSSPFHWSRKSIEDRRRDELSLWATSKRSSARRVCAFVTPLHRYHIANLIRLKLNGPLKIDDATPVPNGIGFGTTTLLLHLNYGRDFLHKLFRLTKHNVFTQR